MSTLTATSFVGNVTGNATGITTTQITIGDTFLKPTSIGIGATSNSGRNAGVSTAALIYNSDIGSIQVYANGAWSNISQDTSISATGGLIGEYEESGTAYRLHVFTGSSTF